MGVLGIFMEWNMEWNFKILKTWNWNMEWNKKWPKTWNIMEYGIWNFKIFYFLGSNLETVKIFLFLY
jgi:hypothetical protein